VIFTGRVVDAEGKRAAGAAVVLALRETERSLADLEKEPAVYRTTTTRAGQFRLPVTVNEAGGSGPGGRPIGSAWRATVVAFKPGHGPGAQFVTSSQGPAGLTIALTRPGVVAGSVADREGRPVAGARVRVVTMTWPGPSGGYRRFEEIPLPAAETDADGRFRIAPLPAGIRVELTVEHPDYAPWEDLIGPVPTGSEDADLVLRPPGVVTGRVLDAEGNPAPGVRVRTHDRRIPDTVTDTRGEFRFERLAAKPYFLHGELPGASPELVSRTLEVTPREGAEVRVPDLRLERGGVVTGTVLDDQGQPLAGVALEVVAAGTLSEEVPLATRHRPRAQTAPDGTYHLRLPLGRWLLVPALYLGLGGADFVDFSPDYRELSVTADQTPGADFTLHRGDLLRGKVLDNWGRPAAGVEVQATSVGFGGHYAAAITDAEGRFTGLLFPRRDVVRVTVHSRDRLYGAEIRVVIARGGSLVIARLKRLIPVTGVVTDGNGTPIADAVVDLFGLTRGERETLDRLNRTFTDARGRFALGLFPADRYAVLVEANGFGGSVHDPLAPRRGRPPSPLIFRLERADGFITGTVVDTEGHPLPGALVSGERYTAVGETQSVAVVSEQTFTDAEGRFRLKRLPPGSVTLETHLAGYRSDQRESVTVGTTGLQILLQRAEAPARCRVPGAGCRVPGAGLLAPSPRRPGDTARLEVHANPQGVDGTVVDGTSKRGRRYNLVGSDSGLVTVPPNPVEPIQFDFGFTLQSTGTDGFATFQGVGVTLQLDNAGAVTSGEAYFQGSVDVPPGDDGGIDNP
jgi:protocatechuate 3,4-dioxygenase beta subunit